MSTDAFYSIEAAITESVSEFPNTPETRSALISLFVSMASGLAEQEPEPLRLHWAKYFENHAARLSTGLVAPSAPN